MPNRADHGDGHEVPVAVDEERVVLASELCDAAVDGASHGVATPPEIEEDADSVAPGVGPRLQAVPVLRTVGKYAPFVLVARSPEQLDPVAAAPGGEK